MVEDISHEGLRKLLRAENVSFQAVKTWKASADPEYAAKKARVDQLYAIADGEGAAGPGDPDVVYCVDEFGPLNLQPRPGRAWARRGGTARDPGERPRRRLRATYHRTGGVRHLFAALDLGTDKMYGHIKKRKRRGEFLQFCRYVRSLHPPQVRIAIVCDNFSPHLTTGKDNRGGQQRRDRPHAHELLVVESHRMPVHRAARVHPQRNRPRHAPRAGQHDPPLHRLAEPQHRQPPATPHRRAGERGLTWRQRRS